MDVLHHPHQSPNHRRVHHPPPLIPPKPPHKIHPPPGGTHRGSQAQGYCQVYRGVTCAQYIGNRTVFIQPPNSLSLMEEKLAAAFTVVATSHDVSADCHRYAIPSLCFFAFPLCFEDSHLPPSAPRPPSAARQVR